MLRNPLQHITALSYIYQLVSHANGIYSGMLILWRKPLTLESGIHMICIIRFSCRIEHKIPPRIISLIDNKSGISRLRDARDTIAVGQQGQALFLLVEPQGYFKKSPSP